MSPAKRPAIRKRSLDSDRLPAAHLTATRTISRAYGRAVAGFTLVAVLLAGVILTVTGSRATVTVVAEINERAAPFTIAIASGQTSSTDSLPGRLLELATTTSETVAVAAPIANTPDPSSKAGGQVTLSNSSNVPQSLVATTRLLSTRGLLFRTTRPVTVPAHGSVTAQVLADQGGAEYVIGPTTFTVPGLNPARQREITGANDVGFAQVDTPLEVGITQTQIDGARAEALAAITGRLSPLLQASLFDNETLTDEAVTTTPLDLKTNVEAGDPVTSVTFTGSVRVSATLFNDQELRRRAAASAGEGADAASVRYTVLRAPTGSAAIATAIGTVTVRSSELSLAPEDLTGRTKADARVYLELLPGVDSAEVKLRPRWFTHLPQDPSRITIVVR